MHCRQSHLCCPIKYIKGDRFPTVTVSYFARVALKYPYFHYCKNASNLQTQAVAISDIHDIIILRNRFLNVSH